MLAGCLMAPSAPSTRLRWPVHFARTVGVAVVARRPPPLHPPIICGVWRLLVTRQAPGPSSLLDPVRRRRVGATVTVTATVRAGLAPRLTPPPSGLLATGYTGSHVPRRRRAGGRDRSRGRHRRAVLAVPSEACTAPPLAPTTCLPAASGTSSVPSTRLRRPIHLALPVPMTTLLSGRLRDRLRDRLRTILARVSIPFTGITATSSV